MSSMDSSAHHLKQEPDLLPCTDHHPHTESVMSDFAHSPTLSLPDADLIPLLVDIVNEIANIGDHPKKMFKTEFSNLTRRVKLLGPLFEEVRELRGELPEQAVTCFRRIERTLQDARELLKTCIFGSKIYMVLERDSMLAHFLRVTLELEQALGEMPYSLLDISDEVREQAELVHLQLSRAKGRVDVQDIELKNDICNILNQQSNKSASHAALERLAEKLALKTQSEIKQETNALNLAFRDGQSRRDRQTDMFFLLERLKEIAVNDVLMDTFENEKNTQPEDFSSPIIPDDFRCPISLELMRDPVIVATGQTYERACIQKWIDKGNKTCPKTQQLLSHLLLTPNYVLKSLITQWCETHGIELPKKTLFSDVQAIGVLCEKLASDAPDVQRAAAGEIRMLAKRNAENRSYIAKAGAIPLLVALLSSPDPKTQENAVTALLNLSIHEENKGLIVKAMAIDPIVEVLKNGSTEARENAAATLFSLSVVDENKVSIGNSDAIPALVCLLRDGSLRGKKDAATALFNLSIYQGNKAKAVRANVVPPLMALLVDPSSDMVDEGLAILAILASHPEGKLAISQASAIPALIDLIKEGSPRNKENAAAILLSLCTSDLKHTSQLMQFGGQGPLTDLLRTGTTRARRKASALLEYMKKLQKETNLNRSYEHNIGPNRPSP